MARKDSNKNGNHNNATGAAKTGYFARTARPIYALIFLLPVIVIYEILVLVVNPQLLSEPVSNIRGGVVAFVWIQNFLLYIGLDAKNSWLCAPLVIIVILLLLQLTSRKQWKIIWSDFLVMACECIAISLPLIVLAMVLNRPAQQRQPAGFAANKIIICSSRFQSKTPAPIPQANIPNHKTDNGRTVSTADKLTHHSFLMDIITGIGAGIYEELIFRLVLIGLLMLFFETILGIEKTKAIVISVLFSAILFSLHHHFVFLNGRFAKAELLTMAPFIFRTIAGAYFAVVFAVRGFGVVAGAHIFYDIIATILNVWLFNQY
ncbi:MAG: CPBP family intramembrane glutamic endopeptidase [Sedimentisphaerales bacterium]|jgi:hypothetical protein